MVNEEAEHKVTLSLLLRLFDGNGFVYDSLKKIPNVVFIMEDDLEETYFRCKYALLKTMKECKTFETEESMFGYIFGVIRNSYYEVRRTKNLKKNTGELVDLKNARQLSSDIVGYNDLDDYLRIAKNKLSFDKRLSINAKKLTPSDKVSIFFSNVIEGYPADEIKDAYGVSKQSINNASNQVRSIIKEQINNE